MTREFGENRLKSTRKRDNYVHSVYEKLVTEIGEYAHYLPRYIIYEKIREETGLCVKTIATILNHTVADK